MPCAITGLSVRALAQAIREGDLRATDATAAYLERIGAVDTKIRAFSRVSEQLAWDQAEAVDAAYSRGDALGTLAGVPMGLKDNLVTRGVETRAGSRILAGWVPPYDGGHAAALAKAGAVLLGKLAMDEFAMGSSNENTPDEPVRNPWARQYVPGGSSGGSAASVACRTVAFALGTDTGGSIRQPASLCNVVGLKPTYGRVTRHGMIAFASSLEQAGPLARDVRDAAVILGVLAGVDPQDATTVSQPVPDYLQACSRGIKDLRIGVDRRALDHEGVEDEVRTAFFAALDVLSQAGARIVDVEFPHFEYGVAAYYVISPAEAASNLARYDGVRYGLRVEGPEIQAMYEATRAQGFGAEVKRRLMLGTFVLRKDTYEAYYGRAQRVRTLVARDHQAAFQHCDLVASPTSPVAGIRRGERVDDPLTMYLADVFTVAANLTGLPAISVPAGFTSGAGPRLPMGLQLMAPHFREDVMLAAAAAHEDATKWHQEVPSEVVS